MKSGVILEMSCHSDDAATGRTNHLDSWKNRTFANAKPLPDNDQRHRKKLVLPNNPRNIISKQLVLGRYKLIHLLFKKDPRLNRDDAPSSIRAESCYSLEQRRDIACRSPPFGIGSKMLQGRYHSYENGFVFDKTRR